MKKHTNKFINVKFINININSIDLTKDTSMKDPAVEFSMAYDKNFRTHTKGYSHNEIPLFRALNTALISLSGAFDVEEYHGTAHQVKFTGNGSYARINARCELSDLMIVSFSQITRSVRLTYLQAKSERAVLSSVCGRRFSANLEQWFLLENRPPITGAGNFKPPSDLLSSALLSSVGSFAFFYKDPKGDFQTYYAAASHLAPPHAYSQRYGKLQARGACGVTASGGHAECLAACDNRSFAESLYRLEIGTPIDSSIHEAASTRDWLSANLRGRITEAERTDAPSRLARELLGLLASDGTDSSNDSFGAKNLIIIKSNVEPADHFRTTRR